MTLKLKLHREAKRHEPEREPGDSLRFPVRAVQEMAARGQSHAGAGGAGVDGRAPVEETGVLRHPELIRQIEATLDRMQAGINSLNEQVSNYKFPGARDGERPRAA